MEIHHCIHCGTETQPNWRFCRRCGTGLADLEQVPRGAECGNCATALADGWRFCPNCGTDSDGAARQKGLSADDVADLIAKPEEDTAAPAVEVAPAVDETAAPVAAELEPEQPATPQISGPTMGFEPVVEADDGVETVDGPRDEPIPPPSEFDLLTEAPAPPPDPLLTIAEIEARLAADQPPLPGNDFGEVLTPEIVADETGRPAWDTAPDVAATADDTHRPAWDTAPDVAATADDTHRPAWDTAPDVAATSQEATTIPGIDETQAVVIPPPKGGERPDVPTELPTPMGSPPRPARDLPRPIGADSTSTWSPTPVESTPQPTGELAPIDRVFRDPGPLGQLTQLALLATAAISVAMVVAHIVLNNRLTDYAQTGESVPRVESVQSIIGSWLRPLLIIAVLGVYLVTVVWARRVVANIAVFGKHVPEAALWMWAIPLVNILVLRQHIDSAWRGSDILLRDDPEWNRSPGNWWALGFAALAIATVGVLFYGSIFDAKTVEGSIDSNAYLMIGYSLLGGALLGLVRAISGVIERQHSRARHFV